MSLLSVVLCITLIIKEVIERRWGAGMTKVGNIRVIVVSKHGVL